ncbi:MAG: hypothetical protein ACK5LS_04815 [Propioniciclava sp.]
MSAAFGSDPGSALEGGPAVDGLDVAARIEASGRGDHAARALGYDDVFAQADAQFAAPVVAGVRDERPGDLRLAAERAIFLVAGVALCVETIVPGISSLGLLLAGSGCWFAAQMVSTILWWGQSRGESVRTWRFAFWCGIGLLAVATLVAAVMASAQITIWTAWGCAAAVVLWRWPGRASAAVSASAATVAGLVHLVSPVAGAVTAAAAIGASAIAVMVVAVRAITPAQLIGDSGPPGDRRGAVAVLGETAVRVSAQIATMVVLWQTWPESFLLVALGAVTAGAVGEIILEQAAGLTRRVADSTTRWRDARVYAVAVGAAAMTLITIAGVAAVGSAAQWLRSEIPAVVLAVFVLNTGVGVAVTSTLRIGAADQALRVAVLGLILVVLIALLSQSTIIPAAWAVGAAALGALVTTTCAAQSFAVPQAW